MIYNVSNATDLQVQLEINKLTGKELGVDVTDCNRLAAHLDYTGLAVIANMSSCITNKLDIGREYVQSIVTLTENVLANLTTIREEARHCGDDVDGVSSAAAAIVCTNMVSSIPACKNEFLNTKLSTECKVLVFITYRKEWSFINCDFQL